MVDFVPSVWKAEGEKVSKAGDAFYRQAEPVIVAPPVAARTNSQLETALESADKSCHDDWHRLVGRAFEGLTSLGSKMEGAGTQYQATEADAAAAARRFWGKR